MNLCCASQIHTIVNRMQRISVSWACRATQRDLCSHARTRTRKRDTRKHDTRIRTQICRHAHARTHRHAHAQARTRARMHALTHARLRTHAYTHAHAHAHARAHTHHARGCTAPGGADGHAAVRTHNKEAVAVICSEVGQHPHAVVLHAQPSMRQQQRRRRRTLRRALSRFASQGYRRG